MNEPSPKTMAAIDLLRRTGAKEVQIRFSDDEQPVVWMAVAGYERPRRVVHQVAAGLTTEEVLLALCEKLVDGGKCQHCDRPTMFLSEHGDPLGEGPMFCRYQWDPELATFRRSCEGETHG